MCDAVRPDRTSAPHWHWQLSECIEALDLDAGHVLLDFSRNEGIFARDLSSAVGCKLQRAPAPRGAQDDKTASGEPSLVACDRGLLWGFQDHSRGPPAAGSEDGAAFLQELRTLRKHLKPGSKLLVAIRRYGDLPWPSTWKLGWPKCEEDVVRRLRSAGYDDVTLREVSYPCELSLDRWCAFLRSRSWSNALEKHISDDQLHQGIENLREQFGSCDCTVQHLQFRDCLVFITAEVSIFGPKGEPKGSAPKRRRTTWASNPKGNVGLEMAQLRPLPLGLRLARDGFVAPLQVLSSEEAAEALFRLDQHVAATASARTEDKLCVEDLDGDNRFKLHVLYPWAERLVRHPKLLDAVRAALGTDDVLVWFSDVNAKGPYSLRHAARHQDGTYASLSPSDLAVTVWLALTDSSTSMGGLIFQQGSHLQGQLPHRVDLEEDNMIGFCSSHDDSATLDASSVPVELRAGEASLHTFRTVHWSGPNLTPHRRVGLAIRHVAAAIGRNRGLAVRETATLAAGCYDPSQGVFDLEPPPADNAGPAERAVHADAMAREQANYSADIDEAA
ncbi:unnamed protein product [Polarella glacialis]|uniref:Phytanoyl-CoA dioxygenase n=1 Tax=Polarella glacialis TaxID=89957 RepID=A0A813LQR3_POLGL|nr:unnamed protein product [Polarella glacialis]